VNYQYLDYQEAVRRYPIDRLREGHNEVAGDRFYFIPTPSAGLWATKDSLYNRPGGFGED
jgi:hypothetical protein